MGKIVYHFYNINNREQESSQEHLRERQNLNNKSNDKEISTVWDCGYLFSGMEANINLSYSICMAMISFVSNTRIGEI